MDDFKCGVNVFLTHTKNKTMAHLVGTVHTLGERCPQHKDSWLMNPEIFTSKGKRCSWHESQMIPLRDSDGQDETLTWAPVPKKVEA